MFRRIYLDNAATTPIDPHVVEAMMPYLTEQFGNPSSIHHFGQEAKAAIDKARHQVAALINARPNELIFTSGGTEASNLAIRGTADGLVRSVAVRSSDRINAQAAGDKGAADEAVRGPGHIITSCIEHPSVLNTIEDLGKQGVEVTYLPVYENGIVRVAEVQNAIRDNTAVISVMMANNEIGTLQPVQEIGRLVRELREQGRKILFHTDAVQALGKIPVDVEEIGCDLLSISAHKIYAPKGVGALYVRRGVRLHPQNLGGHQERERRGGTESVPLIVAFGTAADLLQSDRDGSPRSSIPRDRSPDVSKGSTRPADLVASADHSSQQAIRDVQATDELRDRFENGIGELIPDLVYNGDREKRLPNISNISFPGIEGEGLLINLDMQGIAVSTGSACSSGTLEPSPVIRALGRDDATARAAIRFSFGRFNTDDDVDQLLEKLPRSVETLRSLAPSDR